jgi:Uma2 family endonuclease
MMMVGQRSGLIVGHARLQTPRPAEHRSFMSALRKYGWSIDQVEHLIQVREGFAPRYELIGGQLLVTPAPSGRHQRIAWHLSLLLHRYVTAQQLGEVRLGPGAVKLRPSEYVEPDVYVVPSIGGRRPRADAIVDRLLLAAEVISPSSRRHDRTTKREYFHTHGVPEYWVVDGEAETFEISRPGDLRPIVVRGEFNWHPEGAGEALVVNVREFFAEVADDPA